MKKSPAIHSISQHRLGKSFLLHIVPGLCVTAAFLALKPLSDSIGYPTLMAFIFAILLVDIPLMLGIMLIEGKKLNGRFSLMGVVEYREKVPWKTFVLVFIGAFIVLYMIIMFTAPLSSFLASKLSSRVPQWFFLDHPAQYENYAKNILVLVFTLQLLITGFLLPWVEELYFRGYLLPRISRFGGWAPLIGGALFGLYHGWQLYDWVGVSLLGIGLGYVVWWKKDIRLGIGLHVFANAIVRFILLMNIIAM